MSGVANLPPMRYVVTGAAGFIGSHLAEQLLSEGHDVVGIDSFTDYYDPALKEENARNLDVRRLDLADDPLDFAGVDGVFHLAGQPGVRSFGDVFPLYLQRNLLASQRVFEAAARDGARVVFASSSSVYGAAERYPTTEDTTPHPLSPYGITKLGVRAPRRRLPAPVRARRRRAPLLQCLRAAPAPRHGLHAHRLRARGGRRRSSCTGTGSSRGAGPTSPMSSPARSARWSGGTGTYNVGGALEASMNESIALLEALSGRTLAVRRHPAVAGDQKRTKADTSRIRDELGWAPLVSLEDGLARQWAWASARVGAA